MVESAFARLALGVCLAACSTDTSGLARRAPAPGAEGGAGAEPVAAGGSGGEAAVAGSGGAPGGAELGPGVLGVVHGIVDGGELSICLRDPESGELLGGGAPAPPGGLAYGTAHRLPIEWSVEDASVEVHLFASAASTGWSCQELIEGAEDAEALAADAGALDGGGGAAPFPTEPATPRRAGSVRLPPGALLAGRVYALIAAGCAAPGASPPEDICGAPDPFGSRRGLVLVPIAEAPAGSGDIGLQFVNASRAVPRAGVVLQSETGQNPVALGEDVPFGAVRPPGAAAVREPVGLALVQAVTGSGFTQLWQEALAAGGDTEAAPGSSYLLAFLGPAPAALPEGVSPPRFVLLRGR